MSTQRLEYTYYQNKMSYSVLMRQRSPNVIQMDNVIQVLKITCAPFLDLLTQKHIISLDDFFLIFSFYILHLFAIVGFHPFGLPEGWVKELAFRKTK
jgi:hypothetical protein